MPEIPLLAKTKVPRPAQTAHALGLVSRMDLLRLKSIARVYARGLPPEAAWEDMLQEALTRIITGSRRQPEGVTTVAFVAGVLRSLRAQYWRRAGRERGGRDSVALDRHADESLALALADRAAGPERALSARQELIAIRRLFAGDAAALQIIEGLGEGLSARQIRLAAGLSKTDYDSARRRMRRTLLREGLTCEPK